MSTRISQGILLVSLVPCVLGKLGTGWVLDRGAPSILLNAGVLTIGAGAGEAQQADGICSKGLNLGG